ELFSGLRADQVTRKGEPVFGDAYTGQGGDLLLMTIVSPGSMMCWDADDFEIQTLSLAAIRVGRPARELNRAGMEAYRAGRFKDAQEIFRAATAIAPHALRPLYNLAAVSARLGNDDEAIASLKQLRGQNSEVLQLKIRTDPDFSEALK